MAIDEYGYSIFGAVTESGSAVLSGIDEYGSAVFGAEQTYNSLELTTDVVALLDIESFNVLATDAVLNDKVSAVVSQSSTVGILSSGGAFELTAIGKIFRGTTWQ